MKVSTLASRVPIFPLFIAVSLLVGGLIPGFYRWTGSDQSRPSPLLWVVPLVLAIASVAFCSALPWLPITTPQLTAGSQSERRFSLRALLTITGILGIAMALLSKFPLVTSGTICACAYVYAIVFYLRSPQHRTAIAALLACLLLPYGWVATYKELALSDFVVFIPGMPAFVPAAVIGQLNGQNMHSAAWPTFLLTALELTIGVWMIRGGLKRTIAYLLLVMQVSALGSLALHMLCLA